MRKFELPQDAEVRARLQELKDKALRTRDGRMLCDDESLVAAAIVIGVDELIREGELERAHYSGEIERRNGDFDEPEGGASKRIVGRAWEAMERALEEPGVASPGSLRAAAERDPAFQPANA